MAKKRNPQDSTLRNVRAAQKKLKLVDHNLNVLRKVHNTVAKDVERLEKQVENLNQFARVLIQLLEPHFPYIYLQGRKVLRGK